FQIGDPDFGMQRRRSPLHEKFAESIPLQPTVDGRLGDQQHAHQEDDHHDSGDENYLDRIDGSLRRSLLPTASPGRFRHTPTNDRMAGTGKSFFPEGGLLKNAPFWYCAVRSILLEI